MSSEMVVDVERRQSGEKTNTSKRKMAWRRKGRSPANCSGCCGPMAPASQKEGCKDYVTDLMSLPPPLVGGGYE